MPLTITEALAEIKTIDKRIAAKRDHILAHLARQEGAKDPLEKDGGQKEMIRREWQAIGDLQQRKVDLRQGINSANANNSIAIEGIVKSIAEWITWRRDVAPQWTELLTTIANALKNLRADAQRKGFAVAKEGEGKFTDLVFNIDEVWLAEETDRLQNILGTLDGQLSLKNATIIIRD